MQYNSIARFAFGDLTEALLMLVMREAGIDIVDFQKEVALRLRRRRKRYARRYHTW